MQLNMMSTWIYSCIACGVHLCNNLCILQGKPKILIILQTPSSRLRHRYAWRIEVPNECSAFLYREDNFQGSSTVLGLVGELYIKLYPNTRKARITYQPKVVYLYVNHVYIMYNYDGVCRVGRIFFLKNAYGVT